MGMTPTTALAKIWKTNPMEINVIATPARTVANRQLSNKPYKFNP